MKCVIVPTFANLLLFFPHLRLPGHSVFRSVTECRILGQDGRCEDGNPIHGSLVWRAHAVCLVSPLGRLCWTYWYGGVHGRYLTHRRHWSPVLRRPRGRRSPAREGVVADGFRQPGELLEGIRWVRVVWVLDLGGCNGKLFLPHVLAAGGGLFTSRSVRNLGKILHT